MPYCQNCGKFLADGETCNCTPNPSVNIPPQNQYYSQPYPQQQYQYPPPQPYPQQYPYGQPPQQQKKTNGCLIAFLVTLGVMLFIVPILAVIFVPAFIGYNKKAKTAVQASNAQFVSKAFNTVLADYDNKGTDIDGTYIISSDSAKNSSAIPFDVGDFRADAGKFFSDLGEIEYFAVVKDGKCVYAATAKNWYDTTLGSYPTSTNSTFPCYYSSSSIVREQVATSDNLSDVYDRAVSELN